MCYCGALECKSRGIYACESAIGPGTVVSGRFELTQSRIALRVEAGDADVRSFEVDVDEFVTEVGFDGRNSGEELPNDMGFLTITWDGRAVFSLRRSCFQVDSRHSIVAPAKGRRCRVGLCLWSLWLLFRKRPEKTEHYVLLRRPDGTVQPQAISALDAAPLPEVM